MTLVRCQRKGDCRWSAKAVSLLPLPPPVSTYSAVIRHSDKYAQLPVNKLSVRIHKLYYNFLAILFYLLVAILVLHLALLASPQPSAWLDHPGTVGSKYKVFKKYGHTYYRVHRTVKLLRENSANQLTLDTGCDLSGVMDSRTLHRLPVNVVLKHSRVNMEVNAFNNTTLKCSYAVHVLTKQFGTIKFYVFRTDKRERPIDTLIGTVIQY